ncbi:hypothetical protein OPT61_g7811 [Boeremia exigua]|uniref:Uncharacterized protein n=1 Tax=Boeremia exigua TaxID=749465 RepID=A0ACC2I0S1_9PLEO|nr:hypothetical protein OPT61_g7811 [Boeremia exigua]
MATALIATFHDHLPYTTFARSSTFPRPATKPRVRPYVTEFHSTNPKSHTPGEPSRQNLEPKTAVSTDKLATPNNSQPITMASKREVELKECPTCKRKLDNEATDEKPAKVARKNNTVDIDADIEDTLNQLPPLPSPPLKPHALFKHCMPPEAPVYRDYSVFLAGSIEMGKAVQWQKQMATCLSDLPITVNNPRRGHWDPNVSKEAKDADFRHQVEWELAALEKADVICFFFDATTISPVTMMELGLWAKSKKVVVCCDKRFWRAGNIHIVCERYGVPFVEKFEDLVPAIKDMLEQKGMQLDKNGDLVK